AELCGGCHVRATGDIGLLKITSESAISAGVRRIVALTGRRAEEHLRQESRVMEHLKAQLSAATEELPEKINQLLEERRRLERELKSLKRHSHAENADELLKKAQKINGVSILASEIEAESVEEMRGLADSLRSRMRSGIAVIAAVIGGKGSLLCVVSDDLVRKNVKAGDIVNRVADIANGRGGGPPHMATAGAKDLAKLPQAVRQAPAVIDAYLSSLST
ncbi:MAG: alanine--tRNA ligase, partial [SAR324 cluster bacterium]|nr:alanine--tRNA ligase [SAR324 cluster bacterium]